MIQVTQSDCSDHKLNAEMRSLDVAQWKYLVSHIDEPATAQVIVEYLDNYPMARAHVGAIYMRARDTVLRSRSQRADARRWGERLWRSVGRVLPSARRHASMQGAVAGFGAAMERPAEPLVWPELRPELLSAGG